MQKPTHLSYLGSGPPPPPPPPPPPGDSRSLSDEAVRKFLCGRGWPTGLRNALLAGFAATPVRFMICDDSGSMMGTDGHRVVGEGAQSKVITCSRWAELAETLRFHMQVAHLGCAPTEFRMLNGAAPISIGSSSQADIEGLPIFQAILDGCPGGGTPLCYHVSEIAKKIMILAPDLRAAGKKAALVIFTDGQASDGDIATALKPLNDLPVWVVIRLCTDEAPVVNYWTAIDGQLELNMEVIDDAIGEAKEIQAKNKWLNYAEPLHRLREFGVTAKQIDMLDEVMLSKDQLHSFCAYLFGVRGDTITHPDANFKDFLAQVSLLNDREPRVWNPLTQVPSPWIDMKALMEAYGP